MLTFIVDVKHNDERVFHQKKWYFYKKNTRNFPPKYKNQEYSWQDSLLLIYGHSESWVISFPIWVSLQKAQKITTHFLVRH